MWARTENQKKREVQNETNPLTENKSSKSQAQLIKRKQANSTTEEADKNQR
jgi:hypothetical protein